MNRSSVFVVPAILALTICAAPRVAQSAAEGLEEATFRRHVAVLASDEFEGRKPATRGEEKTVAYLSAQFEALGLEHGNGSSWIQEVPLVEITADPDTKLLFARGEEKRTLDFGTDMVVWTKRVVPRSGIQASELVFVGYGIVAPEFGWNDYAAADIKEKTAVILINDPGFVTGDPKQFAGRAMTYHGRWTYKFEEAARQGAAGAIIIHETEPASYGWQVVVSSWSGPQLDKTSADDSASRVAIEGWITNDSAARLFEMAGKDYAALKAAATRADFKAVPLGVRATVTVSNAIRRSKSANVIGVRRGSTRPDEFVIYLAHWDHLGRSPGGSGDTIFNGAVDNATGVAGLLTLAQAFRRAKPAPERSVVFLAVTAEESGLLGSAYYAEHPIVPLERTAAVINMDSLYPGGVTREISVVGHGSSELEDYLREAAAKHGRVIEPEPTPERGYFYRSDHFNLAKKGVPALYTKLGIDDRARGVSYGKQLRQEYDAKRYHQPADEYDSRMEFSGSLADLGLLFDVGYRVSTERRWPNWYPGNEFRAAREGSSAARR